MSHTDEELVKYIELQLHASVTGGLTMSESYDLLSDNDITVLRNHYSVNVIQLHKKYMDKLSKEYTEISSSLDDLNTIAMIELKTWLVKAIAIAFTLFTIVGSLLFSKIDLSKFSNAIDVVKQLFGG